MNSSNSNKFLIVGLGNVGEEYAFTRHNTGFMVLDRLAKQLDTTFEDRRYGFVARASFKGRSLILLKPSTYVNLSGNAVRYWLNKENIILENLLIVVDDLSLPFGHIRIRASGGDGGHNGLKSITQLLGTSCYCRLRIGIGADSSKGKCISSCFSNKVEYVLGRYGIEELASLEAPLITATDAIKSFVFSGAERTMNAYNKHSFHEL